MTTGVTGGTDSVRTWLRRHWTWLVAGASLAGQLGVSFVGAQPFNMIDLRVYYDAAGSLPDGHLYDFVSGSLDLPFTYPPFAALLFWPLHLMSWLAARWLTKVVTAAALMVSVYLALQLLGAVGADVDRRVGRNRVLLAFAAALWLQPVSLTLALGQVNLVLMAVVLAGVLATRSWLAGASVGIAAGIKLVPAITGLYYLIRRQWWAAGCSVLFFAATVALSLVVLPAETRLFFGSLIGQSRRVGDAGRVANQSLRGALGRLAGHDVSGAAVLYGAIAVTLLLTCLAAWRAVAAGDRLGALLAVELAGLLVSPISWGHHWVWVVPLLAWCLWGRAARTAAVRGLGAVWALATLGQFVTILVAVHPDDTPFSRPGLIAWLDSVYVVLALVAIIVIGRSARSGTGPSATDRPAAACPSHAGSGSDVDSTATRESGAPG